MKRTPFGFSLTLCLVLLSLGMGRAFAASLMVVAAPGVTTLPQAAPPTARCDFDIRLASDDSPIAQTFTLRNGGAAPVTVARIEPSCGCTTAVLSGAQVLPVTLGAGQTVAVNVSVNPGHVAPGAVRKTVWVYTTDDADHPAALLEMVGTIHAEDTPAALTPKAGQTAPAFTLADTNGKPFTLAALRGRPVVLYFFCGCPECAAVAHRWGASQRRGHLPAGTQTVVVFAGDKAAVTAFASENGLDMSQTRLLPDSDSRVTGSVYKVTACPRVFVLNWTGVIQYTNDHPDDTARHTPAEAIAIHTLAMLLLLEAVRNHEKQL